MTSNYSENSGAYCIFLEGFESDININEELGENSEKKLF